MYIFIDKINIINFLIYIWDIVKKNWKSLIHKYTGNYKPEFEIYIYLSKSLLYIYMKYS